MYKAHIANGVEMMMAGHIALPQYSKKLNPALSDEDIMPATLAEEITLGLLKTQLDFNGMVVTDASHMLGMTSATTREKQLPMAIAAGCDMFLFFNDIDEDFNYMLAGYRNGTISQERLHDALRRILGLKAKLGLAAKKDAGTLLRPAQDLDVIGCDAHLAMRAASADQCITLVKDTHKNLPLTPAKHKRIRLFWHTQSDNGGIYVADDAAGAKLDNGILADVAPTLLAQGHEVTVLDNFYFKQNSLMDCCPYEKFQVVRGDCRDEALMKSLIAKADAIIPLAVMAIMSGHCTTVAVIKGEQCQRDLEKVVDFWGFLEVDPPVAASA